MDFHQSCDRFFTAGYGKVEKFAAKIALFLTVYVILQVTEYMKPVFTATFVNTCNIGLRLIFVFLDERDK